VWVVDNASSDGSAEVVRHHLPDAHLIQSGANIGYAAANNLALHAAGFGAGPAAGGPGAKARVAPAVLAPPPIARHALLLNPDTIVPSRALARLVTFLEEAPDIGIAGPKLVRPDGSLDLACRRSFPSVEVSLYRFAGLSRIFPRSKRFGRYNLTYLDPNLPTDVDSVVGACMLVRGDAIAKVGLLDERFWMYGEDLDWAMRIHQAGWRVVYRPQVVIQHVKRASSARSQRARYEFQRAMWLFFQKHYASSTPRPIAWLVIFALALRGGPLLAREMLSGRRAG